MAGDDAEQGGALSTSRAIVAALKALQTRLEEAESARRCEAEKAKERFDAKCQELQQALAQIESLNSKFDLERTQLQQHCEEIKQQRDKALADLAISKHTVHNLKDEIKMTQSLFAAAPSSKCLSTSPVLVDEVPTANKSLAERNIDVIVPSVKITEQRPNFKDQQSVDELERLVYNLLQMNSKLKDERDSIRKQLKLNLGTSRSGGSSTSFTSGSTIPSFAQPRSRRSTSTPSSSNIGQTKTKENRDPVNKSEPDRVQKKLSKTKRRPSNGTQVTESKLRWIQHCIDEIAKSGGFNLKTSSSSSRNRK